jgi:hypothetical protein
MAWESFQKLSGIHCLQHVKSQSSSIPFLLNTHHTSEANDDMVADFMLCCVNGTINVKEQEV